MNVRMLIVVLLVTDRWKQPKSLSKGSDAASPTRIFPGKCTVLAESSSVDGFWMEVERIQQRDEPKEKDAAGVKTRGWVFREWGLGHEMHQLRPRGFYASSSRRAGGTEGVGSEWRVQASPWMLLGSCEGRASSGRHLAGEHAALTAGGRAPSSSTSTSHLALLTPAVLPGTQHTGVEPFIH
uniref:rho GTPase-activating protein 40 n=1 Tax=Halichoerus grypus TaxID=9711 RepID=UPI001659380E|nr:rho GTPase-activating protein 40 [Halichoerus grypus]